MQRLIVLGMLIAVASAQLCSKHGELIPNPRNCQEFLMCRTGRLILFTCPANTLFNARSRSCDPTKAVRCGTGTIAENLITSAIRGGSSNIEHTNTMCIDKPTSMLLSDPQTCSRFYQCSVTGSIAFSCPTGTLFDVRKKTCEDRSVAVCGTVGIPKPPVVQTPVVRPPTLPVVPRPPTNVVSDQNIFQLLCRGQSNGQRVRNPSNCRQFVHCTANGNMRFQDCPAGTSFDNVRKVCDWSHNVKC